MFSCQGVTYAKNDVGTYLCKGVRMEESKETEKKLLPLSGYTRKYTTWHLNKFSKI